MKVELVNCMYEHVFSQSLLYYCISESFYKVPGEVVVVVVIINNNNNNNDRKRVRKKYDQISAIQFLGLC